MNEGTMPFEIGQLTIQPNAPAKPVAGRASAEPVTAVVPPAVVDVLSDIIPPTPPPEVLAEVDAAWERAAELAAQNRQLHFARDAASGRMIIEVRSLDGEVLKTIPPSRALDVISGGAL